MSKSCEVCGKEIVSNRRKKYCSRSCKNTGGSRRHHLKHNGTLKYCIQKLCGEQKRKGLNWEDVYALYQRQEGKCALTGVQMTHDRTSKTTAISIDRIHAGGPYISENIRLVCGIANSMRLNMTDSELYFWCSKLLEYANR